MVKLSALSTSQSARPPNKAIKHRVPCTWPGCCKHLYIRHMKQHRRIHTGEKPYACVFVDCGKAFSGSGNLKKHERTHTGEKPYACDFLDCGKAFSEDGTLKKHKRVHTGEKPYACDFANCGKAFSMSVNLKTHERTHTGEKPYACDFADCDKTFSQSSTLSAHERTHTGDKPYACDFVGCGKAFSVSDTLTKHERTHTGEKPYTCDFIDCGRAFSQSGNLKTHERTHTGEKPYTCDFAGCGKAFSTNDSLKKHERTHTGAKPYACDFLDCGKAFSENGSLKKHERTHTGEKPYACDFTDCGKAFSDNGSLKKHERRHTGEKPYACDFADCGKAFSRSSCLKSHSLRLHIRECTEETYCKACGLHFFVVQDLRQHVKKNHAGRATTVRIKYWESRISQLLTYHDIPFEHNIRFKLVGVNGEDDKTREFDFIISKPDCVIVLEVDERQHGHGNFKKDTMFMLQTRLVNNNTDECSLGEDDDEQDEWTELGQDDECDCTSHYDVKNELDRQEVLKTWLRTERRVTVPIFVVRYNPHTYRVDEVRRNPSQESRESELLQLVRECQPERDEIQYMYYNSQTIDGQLHAEITLHAGYDTRLAATCLPAIV